MIRSRLTCENKIVRFLNRDLTAIVPGLDAVIMIGTTIATTVGYIIAMSFLIKFMSSEFTYLITRVPNFDFQIINGEEMGNPSFLVFSILRDVAFQLFIFVFFLFGMLLILKQAQLASNEVMKKMLQSAVIGVLILLIFPYIWDPISDTAEKSALSLMNPLYTFDEDNPCPDNMSGRDLLFYEHMEHVGRRSVALNMTMSPDDICRPDLLPKYLFAKAYAGADQAVDFLAEDEDEYEWWEIGDRIQAQLFVLADSVFQIIFVGLSKISMLFFLTTMAVFIADMRYLLVDVIAMSLPLLLVLKCIPFLGIDKLSDTLTAVFVPLLFVPIMAALILLAGATDLVVQEERIVTITDPDEIMSIPADRFLFSMHALATLTLVIMSPVMFVPMLGSVSSMAAKMTMTGIMSGIMGTAGMAKGAAGGASAGFSGMKAAGGHSTLGAIGHMMRSPGAMGSVLGGAATGARGAMGGAFSSSLGGAGKIIPGGGGLSTLASGGGGGGGGGGSGGFGVGSDPYTRAYARESQGTVAELQQQDFSAAAPRVTGAMPLVPGAVSTPVSSAFPSHTGSITPLASSIGPKSVLPMSQGASGGQTDNKVLSESGEK